MEQHKIDTVIFDLGGVLVNFQPAEGMRRIGFSEDAVQIFMEKIFSGLWEACDAKQYTDAEIRALFKAQVPDYEREVDLLWDNLHSITGVKPYAKEWLTDLKRRGMKLYVLSNFGNVSFRINSQIYDFLELMDGQVISYELGIVKPDPRIYRTLLERYGIDPDKAVFIDDRKANADGAEAVGIRGLWFRDYEQAKNELIIY